MCAFVDPRRQHFPELACFVCSAYCSVGWLNLFGAHFTSVRLAESWSLPAFFQKSRTTGRLSGLSRSEAAPGLKAVGWSAVLPGLRPLAVSGGAADALPLGLGAPAGISCSLSAESGKEPAPPFFLPPSESGRLARALTAVTEATPQTCVVGPCHIYGPSLPLLSSLLFPSLPSWRMPQGKLSCHPGSLNTP